MRRWNGWGADDVARHLPASALSFLGREAGAATRRGPGVDADRGHLLDAVAPSSAPPHALLITDAATRLQHSFGQSLPDWIALRYGAVERVVDAVAFPRDDAEVRALLAYAMQEQVSVIPYGGGTSVVGHLTPTGPGPVVSLDASRICGLTNLDSRDLLADIGAGTPGPEIERSLAREGFTLGHFPQSWQYSTLGGWIATRSSGQESRRYGRIENLVAGLSLETPRGTMRLPALPASAAGPDLKQLILGSEGRLGVITRATVRVRPVPELRRYVAYILPAWDVALDTTRVLAQSDAAVSMLRLSDPSETMVTFKLSGRLPAALAQALLRGRRGNEGACMLLVGGVGSRTSVRRALRESSRVILSNAGVPLGTPLGRVWERGRFSMPYLRNSLWDAGYALDTVETALPWSRVAPLRTAIRAAVQSALAQHGLRSAVFAHLSHVYLDGASLYTTIVWPTSTTPEETIAAWSSAKGAATQAILQHGGTISHQHGVGHDHRAFLTNEKSEPGMTLLRDALTSLDPASILNPGKLAK